MSLLEKDTLLCECVDVRSLRLRVSSKTTDPVVQIVDSDEQDVRPSVLAKTGTNRQQEAQECEDEFDVIQESAGCGFDVPFASPSMRYFLFAICHASVFSSV